MAALSSVIQRGTRAAQPAASAVSVGTLYCVTDESNIVERSNGSAWQTYTPTGSGTVTTSGSPVSGDIAKFSSATAITKATPGTDYLAPTTPGVVVQVVNTEIATSVTGTTTIPFDDTIPQNTEGTEFMTLAITPKATTNKLRIEVLFFCTNSAAVHEIVALFQDSTADALAAVSFYIDSATGTAVIALSHYMAAGTTSSTTFKVRAGGHATGTTRINGQSGVGRLFGGVAASSITITEIAA